MCLLRTKRLVPRACTEHLFHRFVEEGNGLIGPLHDLVHALIHHEVLCLPLLLI